jgi:hypothetical protein
MEVDEDSPPRRRKSRRDADLPKKKKKPEVVETKKAEAKKKAGGLSQLLGKRRCAAEANERIAKVANQVIASQGPCSETCSNLRRSKCYRKAVCPNLFAVLPKVFIN